MKKEISPMVIVVAIVVILVIVGAAIFLSGRGAAGGMAGNKPPGMPASVQKEFQKRMGGVTPSASAKGANTTFPGVKTTTGN